MLDDRKKKTVTEIRALLYLGVSFSSAWSSWRVGMYFSPGGMRYHLLSPEDREELVEGTRPRRKKHDYRIALFGGSQPQSCRYFNPKVTFILVFACKSTEQIDRHLPPIVMTQRCYRLWCSFIDLMRYTVRSRFTYKETGWVIFQMSLWLLWSAT